MFTERCERIRELTIQAAELVEHKDIQQCLALLVERQTLLEQLQHQVLSLNGNSDIFNTYTALLLWVQQQDTINKAKVLDLRAQSKVKSSEQVKINKALYHYKNLI